MTCRIHAQAAVGHGCITFLLLHPLQKGRITGAGQHNDLISAGKVCPSADESTITIPEGLIVWSQTARTILINS